VDSVAVRTPTRDGQWLIANTGGPSPEVLALVLSRGPHPPPSLERTSRHPPERTKGAPDDATILQHVHAGIARANTDFGTRFVPSRLRCEAYNTSRPEAYERLAYAIVEAAFWETGRHINNPSPAGRPDLRLPAARAQVLRDVIASWPPDEPLVDAHHRLDGSLVHAILAELKVVGRWQSLSLPRRGFAAVRLLESEVTNGGFDQYFFNSFGDSVREALEGLQLMGATDYARLVQAAVHLFPNSDVPRDPAARRKALQIVQAESGDAFVQFDREFSAPDSTPPLEILIVHMALEYQTKFFA
jgi:hypothetical protein